MRRIVLAVCAAAVTAIFFACLARPGFSGTTRTAAPSVDVGEHLVEVSGCGGCHGAGLQGGFQGHSLYGIERKLTASQIADAIAHPKPPMQQYGFTGEQVAEMVAYLSNLDGGLSAVQPLVIFDPSAPRDKASITARFPGTPPKNVSVLPIMQMGSSTMQTREVRLRQSASDRRVFLGRVVFSRGGAWTVRVEYDGKSMSAPLNVAQ